MSVALLIYMKTLINYYLSLSLLITCFANPILASDNLEKIFIQGNMTTLRYYKDGNIDYRKQLRGFISNLENRVDAQDPYVQQMKLLLVRVSRGAGRSSLLKQPSLGSLLNSGYPNWDQAVHNWQTSHNAMMDRLAKLFNQQWKAIDNQTEHENYDKLNLAHYLAEQELYTEALPVIDYLLVEGHKVLKDKSKSPLTGSISQKIQKFYGSDQSIEKLLINDSNSSSGK